MMEIKKYDNKTVREIREAIKKASKGGLSFDYPKTLESIKKAKNWLACVKGYPIDPEGYKLSTLYYRFYQELDELNEVETAWRNGIIQDEEYKNGTLSELADLSNIIDYIASKIITNYPDKYEGENE